MAEVDYLEANFNPTNPCLKHHYRITTHGALTTRAESYKSYIKHFGAFSSAPIDMPCNKATASRNEFKNQTTHRDHWRMNGKLRSLREQLRQGLSFRDDLSVQQLRKLNIINATLYTLLHAIAWVMWGTLFIGGIINEITSTWHWIIYMDLVFGFVCPLRKPLLWQAQDSPGSRQRAKNKSLSNAFHSRLQF